MAVLATTIVFVQLAAAVDALFASLLGVALLHAACNMRGMELSLHVLLIVSWWAQQPGSIGRVVYLYRALKSPRCGVFMTLVHAKHTSLEKAMAEVPSLLLCISLHTLSWSPLISKPWILWVTV